MEEFKKEIKIKIVIDAELEDLIPEYLDRRRADVQEILAAAENKIFERAKTLGHQMKGSGSGYGFDFISEVGAKIEVEATAQNPEILRALAEELESYLNRVEVVFE